MKIAARVVFGSIASSLLLLAAGTASATNFTAGNLAVERIGDGSAALTSAGTAVFIDEFNRTSTSQTPVQSIAVPTATNPLTNSGTATSEGFLTLSSNQQVLTFAGYSAAAGTAGVAGSSVNRVIGTVNFNGNVDTSRSGAMNSGNNIRSAVSSNGSDFWTAGANANYYFNSTPTQLNTSNGRVANIFNNQLYISSSSTAFNGASSPLGIWQIGSGLPTSASPTLTNIINTGTGSSPYDYAFSPDGLTAYIADDRAAASGGGIQKWTLSGGTWSLAYTLGTGTGSTVGARGLAADFSGANPVIFATTAETAADRLISITDTGAASAATTLATSPTNEIFRGVDFVPVAVPEPSTAILAGLAAIGLAACGRRRRS
jgi:hypothetical protein